MFLVPATSVFRFILFLFQFILFDFPVEKMQKNGTISWLLIELHVINFGWREQIETTSTRPFNFITQQTQNICITFIQRRPNVFDVVPALYKCYANVLCLLGLES